MDWFIDVWHEMQTLSSWGTLRFAVGVGMGVNRSAGGDGGLGEGRRESKLKILIGK